MCSYAHLDRWLRLKTRTSREFSEDLLGSWWSHDIRSEVEIRQLCQQPQVGAMKGTRYRRAASRRLEVAWTILAGFSEASDLVSWFPEIQPNSPTERHGPRLVSKQSKTVQHYE